VSHFSVKVVNTLFFIVILYLMNITLWETMFNILEPGNGGWAAYCFGFAFGYLKSPAVNGLLMASLSRIESLPYCYPWDIFVFEMLCSFFTICPFMQVFRMIATNHGGIVFDVSIFLDNAVFTMFFMAIPSYVFAWMHPDAGTRLRMYEWQKRVPFYGYYSQVAFSVIVQRQVRRAAAGDYWGTRPWGRPGTDWVDAYEQIVPKKVTSDYLEASS